MPDLAYVQPRFSKRSQTAFRTVPFLLLLINICLIFFSFAQLRAPCTESNNQDTMNLVTGLSRKAGNAWHATYIFLNFLGVAPQDPHSGSGV